MTACDHPPNRLYAGHGEEPVRRQGQTVMVEFLWIACCDCGAVLKNAPDKRETQRGLDRARGCCRGKAFS